MIENNEGQASSDVPIDLDEPYRKGGGHQRQGQEGFIDLSDVSREPDDPGLIYGPK